MGTVKIINNSTLTDYSAIMRVGCFIAGIDVATYGEDLTVAVEIQKRKGNTYLVLDKEIHQP